MAVFVARTKQHESDSLEEISFAGEPAARVKGGGKWNASIERNATVASAYTE